jgi:hypothetical protein
MFSVLILLRRYRFCLPIYPLVPIKDKMIFKLLHIGIIDGIFRTSAERGLMIIWGNKIKEQFPK